MEIHKNLIIKGSRERNTLMDAYWLHNGTAKPLVVFCHGFKGFKDWGHFELIARELADSGFVVTKFNFSFNGGTVDEAIDFPDLEAFGQNNISTELDDLGLVLDAWSEPGAFVPDEEIDRTNIALIGHSRGGGVVILRAGEDDRVKKLVSLAAIGRVGRMFDDADFLEHWKKEGVIHVTNGRTMQQMPMYYQYYEDYLSNMERQDIPAAAARIRIPWLIVHGSNDPAVPVSHAHGLHKANPSSEMMILEGGDHVFGGKHPWTESELPGDAKKVVERVIEFLGGSKD